MHDNTLMSVSDRDRYVMIRKLPDSVLEMFPVFFFSFSGGVESSWVHLAQRPLFGLLYLPG
jgi:hypothetical protein